MSLWKKKPKDCITVTTLQFAIVHRLHKNKENASVLLELHYVQLHAICTILFLYLGIHTVFGLDRVTNIMHWLVLCF